MIFANRIANGIANRTLTMIGEFIFSWAENAEGRIVHVDSVPRGLQCGCTCPNCHEPLLARHGEKNEHGFSRRRNPILADVFNRLKYMERRGSGFKKIISAYKEHEGYKDGMNPAFSTPWDSFVLTLPKFNVVGIEGVYVSAANDTESNNEPSGQADNFTETLQKPYRNLTEIDRKIVELIVSNKFVTTTQMATQIGKSRQTVATRIKELQERGVVKRKGPVKGGFYEILQ